jgi:hypothetical protein
MHKIRFIIIAETPRVMIISLKYGTAITESVFPVTAFRASIFCKKMKSKKATLQIMVNLEKKETTFIKNNSIQKYIYQNNINLLN